MYSPKRRLRLFWHPAWIAPPPPTGLSANLLSFARTLATLYANYNISPTDGGPLLVNSRLLGNYEVATRGSSTTISSFIPLDWFTNTKDTTSSWIVVNGDLTINPGQTFIPPTRKLFTVLYVSGNLICNGSISMTGRGANHSGIGDSGGATTAVPIRIGTGTFGAVVNPQIPATGGSGADGTAVDDAVSNGFSGTNGGTGGGGGGGRLTAGTSGGGALGTCFSGGAGGGGANGAGIAGTGGANGGKGGDGIGVTSAGGSGNPGGAKGGTGVNGNAGTGGTLIVIVEGTLSGTGTITADGVAGARPIGGVAGGASGGGSVTVLYGADSSSITPTATGGSGDSSGSGGNGTARKLAIGSN